MARTDEPLGTAALLERGRELLEKEPEEMASTVLLGHVYVIAASICQRLDDLVKAVERKGDEPPAATPSAHYRRDEGSPGQGSRT